MIAKIPHKYAYVIAKIPHKYAAITYYVRPMVYQLTLVWRNMCSLHIVTCIFVWNFVCVECLFILLFCVEFCLFWVSSWPTGIPPCAKRRRFTPNISWIIAPLVSYPPPPALSLSLSLSLCSTPLPHPSPCRPAQGNVCHLICVRMSHVCLVSCVCAECVLLL